VDVVVVVQIRKMGWAEHAARMASNGNACRYLEEGIIKMIRLSWRRNRRKIILKWKLREEDSR